MVKTETLEPFFEITITNKYPGRASNDIDLTRLDRLTDEQYVSLYTEI